MIARRHRAGFASTVAVATVLALGPVATTSLSAAPLGDAPAADASGAHGCRAVGGGPASSPGPHRATVVVDTGSGTVWSACISFSGSISGIDAIEAAKAQIPDLAPVYDVYTGEGRAVCKLRGVGNDPPDCLGKTAAYWGYFHNGTYWARCACTTTVSDGDVEGWHWGTSRDGPRPATAGYEAVAAPPPATTTTRPPASGGTPAPGSTDPGPSGGLNGEANPSAGSTPTGSNDPPGSANRSGDATTTTRPGATTTTTAKGSTTTTVAGSSSPAKRGGKRGVAAGSDLGSKKHEQAGRSVPTSVASTSGKGSSSGTRSAIGFAVALAIAAAIGLFLRRRRSTTSAGA